MPIDRQRVVGATFDGDPFSWSEDDLILYGLAIGAGDPPDDPAQLAYVYEGGLVASPTFGTIPPFGLMMCFGSLDGMEVSLAEVLHGDHSLTVHSEIPTSGTVTQRGRVVDVYDRGRGALLVVEVVSTLERTGEPLFTNRAGIYVRGEGGFGGDQGPRHSHTPPSRAPDHEMVTSTLPQQALLYRMASGDKNPLHADPAFAALAGFDRPILHGLCTYGIVARVVIGEAFPGEPQRMEAYRARFTGHVFPGETLVTRVWDEGSSLIVETTTRERGATVLAGTITGRPG